MPNRGYATLFEIDKELAAAFKADCEEFLDEFEKLNSFNFLDFAKVWRLKKFTYVYAGQQYALILKDYTENCFHVVKKFIVFPRSLQSQIGALFLLYGLYYKQPLRDWVKVRLTLEEYEKISELLEEMKSRGCLDPLYIFSKMKIEGAFLFVAQRKPLGPEDRFIKNFEIYYNDTFSVSKVRKVEDKFKELVSESELLKELSTTNSEYQEKLKNYAERCKDLVPMESTIMADLQVAYAGVTSQVQQLTEVEERAKCRRDIRNKAVKKKIPDYRSSKPITKFTNKECEPSGSGLSKKSLKTKKLGNV